MSSYTIFWFRRDLRLTDNHGLYRALKENSPVLPLFIFDSDIIDELPADDPRVGFLFETLAEIDTSLKKLGSGMLIEKGKPLEVFDRLINQYQINAVFTNHDYEPYGITRDQEIDTLLSQKGIPFHTFKDQVIFEKDEVVKNDGLPYTVFTPFKNRWLARYSEEKITSYPSEKYLQNLAALKLDFPDLTSLGLKPASIKVQPYRLEMMTDYEKYRDYPHQDKGSYLGPHLRFGTISVRALVEEAKQKNETFLSELIWREFFMQILYHFPHVVDQSFRTKYDRIRWRNDKAEFQRWCEGKTGFPMVDAGMRQLNETGFMHNRTRMVTASFLCKHLLIDWRWGEAYFAEKLLDYELSSNNGNWQWAAGTGCDAAPYFRVFNPMEQRKKFDKDQLYVRKWIPELGTGRYPDPVVDHSFARKRAIETYKRALNPT